ncbi:PAS domain-containing protein [Phenylobacterium deserti]|uniref:PAS domain-containing protein n=1 Tax=Phenylobacterium deserti TaxID=1914756 RepID=A0A328ASB7_9CAUL|nr:PAS domain-containing protein [Phenylobacterium deserti]RAK56414.1 PAS domain-containing protein [Phenylobacterium deserti]
MYHANTQKLIDYWASRASPGRAPSRSAIQPADFRQLMPQTFILGREDKGQYPVRLAGGFVADLHRRDLRAVNGLHLWSERDRLRLQTALEEARRRPEPLVAVVEALADGASLPMEVLFAPLTAHDGGPDRYLGLYQPLSMVTRLQGLPVLELSVRSLRRPGAANEAASHLRLAAVGGRRIA